MAGKAKININPGDQFGRWIVVQRAPGNNSNGRRWLCLCLCGNARTVDQLHLTGGRSSSCGCLKSIHVGESAHSRFTTHGEAGPNTKTAEYRIWSGIISRCTCPTNPAYPNYGGRGISICSEWRESYECFLSDVGRRPDKSLTLDRIDNNGNYELGNVRWATRKTQCRNTRRNRLIAFNGESLPLSAWAEKIDIGVSTLRKRIEKGWPLSIALTLGTLSGSDSGRISSNSRWHGATREEVLSCA